MTKKIDENLRVTSPSCDIYWVIRLKISSVHGKIASKNHIKFDMKICKFSLITFLIFFKRVGVLNGHFWWKCVTHSRWTCTKASTHIQALPAPVIYVVSCSRRNLQLCELLCFTRSKLCSLTLLDSVSNSQFLIFFFTFSQSFFLLFHNFELSTLRISFTLTRTPLIDLQNNLTETINNSNSRMKKLNHQQWELTVNWCRWRGKRVQKANRKKAEQKTVYRTFRSRFSPLHVHAQQSFHFTRLASSERK